MLSEAVPLQRAAPKTAPAGIRHTPGPLLGTSVICHFETQNVVLILLGSTERRFIR
jgi:hypothetical protein